MVFGPHLTLDLYGCDKNKISSPDFMLKLLDKLPAKIGMTKISEPQILDYPGKEGTFDKGGVSAFVIIAESHIAFHSFSEQEFVSVDIFSCKDFDIKHAEKLLVRAFGAKKVEMNLFDRGFHFPRDLEKSKIIVKNQRKRVTKK